jgi:hypothetical protein
MDPNGLKTKSRCLFVTSLETFLFAKRVRDFHAQNNKIDNVLATQLLELVHSIDSFLKSAIIIEDDDDTAGDPLPLLNKIIPSIESEVFQAQRSYLCVVCNKNVKGTMDGIAEHFTAKGGIHEKVIER